MLRLCKLIYTCSRAVDYNFQFNFQWYNMTEPYCGINNVPKDKHRGSMKECIEKGEVRYYGYKKIDKRLVENIKAKKFKKLHKTQLYAKKGELTGKIKKLKEKIQNEKDPTKKDNMKDEGKKLIKELKAVQDMLKSGMGRTSSDKKGSVKQNGGNGESIHFERPINNKTTKQNGGEFINFSRKINKK